ncbi:mitochondrial metalloendopeptidase OMA1-like [Neltuma alba]|uniref:mitochondrial metalloendopeptidase OMA1-like n=1 Tax=Neltuma alba TaxID=207710 RepID=UPI0010A44C3A|nr:mitochondrial metalloendopeptidase OMA1-like [Prosopis alba]
MGSHGRRSGKLLFDSFRSCSWRIVPKTQILLPNKRFSQHEHFLLMPAWNRVKFHIGISSHSLASQRLGLQGRANRNLCNPFLNEARRFYYVYNVQQQDQRKPRRLRRWFLVGLLIYSGVCAKIYYDHLESVPYHKRTRLILISESQLRSSGETYFKGKSESFGDRILPDAHPESIRVRRIAQDIIDACEAEIQRGGSQLSTARSHLDGLKWEELVVSGSGDAFHVPCDKTVMFDGMPEHLKSDAEVAFLLGHEIGHIVARHYAENLTTAYRFRIMKSMLNPIGLWDAFMNKYAAHAIATFWK